MTKPTPAQIEAEVARQGRIANWGHPAAAEVASFGPDFMPDAPHDGTPVRAWGKWMPAEGVVLRWKDQVGWCADQGLACFEMVDRWEADAADVGLPVDLMIKDAVDAAIAATIERCAQVVAAMEIDECTPASAAAAIRALKDK